MILMMIVQTSVGGRRTTRRRRREEEVVGEAVGCSVLAEHLEEDAAADGRLRVRALAGGRVPVRHKALRALGLDHLEQR